MRYKIGVLDGREILVAVDNQHELALDYLGIQIEQMVSDALDEAAATGEVFTVSADALREMLL